MADELFVRLDPRILTVAAGLAAELHHAQRRKGSRASYVSHLLGVASLVAEDEGTDEEVAAALLHDAAEDQGGEQALSLVEAALGVRVADLVRECSDSISRVGQSKAPWRDRKLAALGALGGRSPAALKIIAADKLHNTRSTVADLVIEGDGVWNRFKTGRDGFVWYHEAMAARLLQLAPHSRSVRLLQVEVPGLRRSP